MNFIERETWKPVKDFEGLYEVSNYGEVKSYHHCKEGKLLSPGKSKGYLKVDLSKNGVRKSLKIHRLVYETFVGEIPPKWDVNHLDENKENNRVENLEACSHGDNMRWGTGIARMAAAQSKAVEAIDKVTGKVVYIFPSIAEAGRQGFHSGNITQCCRGKVKSHKGFIWRYKENAQEQ